MAVARDLQGGDNNVIAVIGDGSMSAGMAYEAMNNAGATKSPLIVILNDNDMSIAPPVGALSAHLSRLISSPSYQGLRHLAKEVTGIFPEAIQHARAAPSIWPAISSSAAHCSNSWAFIISARSTAIISTIFCRFCRMCAMASGTGRC